MGTGILVPASYGARMFLGALFDVVARRRTKGNADAKALPLASCFIAGGDIIAVILTVLIAAGLLAPA